MKIERRNWKTEIEDIKLEFPIYRSSKGMDFVKITPIYFNSANYLEGRVNGTLDYLKVVHIQNNNNSDEFLKLEVERLVCRPYIPDRLDIILNSHPTPSTEEEFSKAFTAVTSKMLE